MTFDEQMVGSYLAGSPSAGRQGDIEVEAKAFASERPAGASIAAFRSTLTVRDLNEFFASPEHEADLRGTIHFGNFLERVRRPLRSTPYRAISTTCASTRKPRSGDALSHLLPRLAEKGIPVSTHGKYMQRDPHSPVAGVREILHDYTTAYSTSPRRNPARSWGPGSQVQDFENLEAVARLCEFPAVISVTGTRQSVLKAQAQLRFLAFTNQFVIREYSLRVLKQHECG